MDPEAIMARQVEELEKERKELQVRSFILLCNVAVCNVCCS